MITKTLLNQLTSTRCRALPVFLLFISFFSVAQASSIPKSTISLGGSVDAAFSASEFDDSSGSKNKLFHFNVSLGFFVIDNLEAGILLYYQSENEGDNSSYIYSQGVYFNYHIPLSEKLNAKTGAAYMTGAGKNEGNTNTIDTDAHGFSLAGGIEYFVTPSVALGVSLTYSRFEEEYELDGHSVFKGTLTSYGPDFSLTVYW